MFSTNCNHQQILGQFCIKSPKFLEIAMAPSVQVFGSPTSAEVARVLTCLFEKDVEFQLIRVDTYKGQRRKPNYLKLQVHPDQYVPIFLSLYSVLSN